jgi:hypothetical protein
MIRRFVLFALCLGWVLPAFAGTYPIGVGVYGGYDVPVLQQDVGSGAMWSAAVRGNIWRFVHGQIVVRGTSQGDREEKLEFGNGQSETLKYPGGKLTGFGLNLLFAAKNPASVWPYGLFGFSSNSFEPGSKNKDSETLMGWSVGGGMGVNLYQKTIYLDVNTSLLVMPFHDNKASRKNWQSLVGVQYFIPLHTK